MADNIERKPTAEEILDYLDEDKGKTVVHLGARWYTRPNYGQPLRRRLSLRDAASVAMSWKETKNG